MPVESRCKVSRAARRAAASAKAALFAAESPDTTIRSAAAFASATLLQTLSKPFEVRSDRRIITAPTSAGETTGLMRYDLAQLSEVPVISDNTVPIGIPRGHTPPS